MGFGWRGTGAALLNEVRWFRHHENRNAILGIWLDLSTDKLYINISHLQKAEPNPAMAEACFIRVIQDISEML